MAWATEKLDLEEGRVRVRTLEEGDIGGLAEALRDPGGWSDRVWGWSSAEKIREALHLQLAARDRAECHPFVYFADGELAGVSRYLHLAPQARRLELGGSCVAPRWRRSFVNSSVKSLLLAHAFESLRAIRVELRVDAGNHRSQMNVLRIGARFEGRIRHWQLRSDGSTPDGFLYAITSGDWPAQKERLRLLREREPPPDGLLFREAASPRLQLGLHPLSDAPELLALVTRNRDSLRESFPRSASLETLGDAEAFIAEQAHWAAAETAYYYGARLRSSGELVGHVHAKGISGAGGKAEIGYYIDERQRRKGLGTEMVGLLRDELLERRGFQRLSLRVVTGNRPSMELAKKLGFRREAVLRSEFPAGDGQWRDVLQFALVKAREPDAGRDGPSGPAVTGPGCCSRGAWSAARP